MQARRVLPGPGLERPGPAGPVARRAHGWDLVWFARVARFACRWVESVAGCVSRQSDRDQIPLLYPLPLCLGDVGF